MEHPKTYHMRKQTKEWHTKHTGWQYRIGTPRVVTLLDTSGDSRMHHNILDLGLGKQILTCLFCKISGWNGCNPKKIGIQKRNELNHHHLNHVKLLYMRWSKKVGYRLWRRARLQGGGCEGLVLGMGKGESAPSVLSKKLLSWKIQQRKCLVLNHTHILCTYDTYTGHYIIFLSTMTVTVNLNVLPKK